MAYTDGSNHPQLAVATQGLVKAYGGFKAVDGLNLRVPAGEVYGLLGPNGAGKSTTMKLLLGLTKPTSGSMWLLGQQVGKKTMIQPGRVGSMIEGPSFYPGLSGLDNCRMVADYLGLPVSAASAVLTKVGLQAYEKRKASAYSLGMKQRLGIAMALISQPELLLLDEPTNGLDAEAVVEMRQMIIDLAASQGITVIISSHILSEIEKMAPVVGIIADGHLLYQGTLENLRDKGHIDLRVSDPELASEILETQGIHHEYIRKSATLRIPEISDPQIGTLVTRLISHGLQVYRVASERKSLEEAFLELVENPQNHVAQGPVKPFGHKQRSIR
ncbi:ABC transporter ATP-binding protein [Bifidobacterium sp. B4107]|uniref:ABC transporter ATP-binding protein n=1 Tax=unclassified Bifidobacterium TaxID=2608897 RepID=UPI00226B1B2D|nr:MULTISPECIES: ABC transporter ATP-binding protein [unclassified Bifidobacterium]MCX8647568.1 ABC transporter ATP-binding protein [Bifidobacterium sp. B4107]MCX8651748.1 ABC transporter ATP-binding protein [Bifidobacterium sp. B4111]MCX8658179.1 ABC transporter ATP-binding protein [Bifidobacterium sp. B4114]MCX8688283.1 ABC transporter ATP-binding protein [Bifidobacterium sp. B4142]